MSQAQRQIRERDEGTPEDQLRRHYPELARILSERRDQILGQVSVERNHLDEQVMTAPGDDADVSVVDTSADYFLKLANNHQRELLEIRDAFDRMHRGVYGVCQNCESSIGIERLRRLPYARFCIDCQRTQERVSRVGPPPRL